jgi:hypothetical protein
MSQRELDVILAKLLAENLALSIFIVDTEGNLIFYNEPAEMILGFQFDDTGPMPAQKWATVFKPIDEQGDPLMPEELPLVIATFKLHPSHRIFWIEGMDGVRRKLAVTAFPLIGQERELHGAMAIFWELKE